MMELFFIRDAGNGRESLREQAAALVEGAILCLRTTYLCCDKVVGIVLRTNKAAAIERVINPSDSMKRGAAAEEIESHISH